MEILAISKNSFHYKYYRIIRKIWGFKEIEKRTSLCKYSQFLFWFTLFTAIVSPFIIHGWLSLKIARLFYKILSWIPFGKKFIDFLDENFFFSDKIDISSNRIKEAPVIALTRISIGLFLFTFIISFAIFLIFGGGYLLVKILPFLPVIIAGVSTWLSLGIFYISCFIGWILCSLSSIIMLGLGFLGKTIIAFSYWIIFFISFLLILSILVLIMIKIVTTVDCIREFLEFKLNGFQKAREKNKKRREKIIEQKKKTELSPFEKFIKKSLNSISNFFKFIGKKITHKTIEIKETRYKVMNVFGLLWNVLKSIKEGICPFVDFIDEKESTK